MSSMWFPLFTLLILWSQQSWSSPAEEPKDDVIPILESTQAFFGGGGNTVANRLDLFFADQRADDELARSRMRIRQRYTVREDSIPVKETQFRLNIKIPSLEEKFRFDWFKSDKEKKKKNPTAEEIKENIAQKELDKDWQFRSSLGFGVSVPPKVSWSNRLRKNMVSGDVIHRFVEEISWFSDRDWEQTTSMDSDLALTENLLLRFQNFSDWKITRKDFTTGHGPALIHRLTDNDALSYSFTTSTIVEGIWYVTNYQLATNYRRNLYHHWLYLDVRPGLDFPKDLSFRRNPFIFFQLEMLFGHGKKL